MSARSGPALPASKCGPGIPIALGAYMALVFALSSFPHPPLPEDVLRLPDKILHCVEYLPLGFLWTLALRSRARRAALLGLLAAALFGISDEFHQSFVPGRDSSALDVAADVLGAALGSALAYRVTIAGRKKKAAF